MRLNIGQKVKLKPYVPIFCLWMFNKTNEGTIEKMVHQGFISAHTKNTFFVLIPTPIKTEKTRWTFFRVKLVFECDFEISWSLGLLDLFPPPPPPHTSSYLLLSSFGMVWYGRGGMLCAYFWYPTGCWFEVSNWVLILSS